MIKNIVFDMGGVMMNFDPEIFADRIGLEGDERAYLLDSIFYNVDWSGLDNGDYTEKEFVEMKQKELPEKYSKLIEQLVLAWDQPVVPWPGTQYIIKELKAHGYKLYLLSNASFRQHDYWLNLPGHQYFDGTVISAYEHVSKPDPEIYYRLYEKFSIKPEESIFIDNVSENVEASVKTGMEGIVFTDARSLRLELKKRNIL